MTEIVDPTGRVHRISRLHSGVVRRQYANRTVEVSQYDGRGRCIAKASQGPHGGWRRRFLRTTEGDLLHREDDRFGPTHYTYDAAGRLQTVTGSQGEVGRYVYDRAGNLLSKPGLSEGRAEPEHDPELFDRPTVAMAPGNQLYRANGDRFHYDARGNLQHRARRGGFISYGRDGVGRLRTIYRSSADGRTSQLVWSSDYDPLGRRIAKRIHTPERTYAWQFFWDGDRLAAEILYDGRLRIYVYADLTALVPMLAIEYASVDASPTDGRCFVLQTDHRGAVERVEDESGRAVWAATIHPHAEATIHIGEDFHQPFRLVGQYWDRETGLCFHRYRTWSPELGRFMESDPIGLEGGSNLYAWPGSPLVATDVLGLGCGDGDNGTSSPRRDGEAEQEGTPPRSPRDMSDAELRQHLDGLAQDAWRRMREAFAAGERTVTLPDGTELRVTNSSRGPCLSLVMDTQTGQVFYGQNTGRRPGNLAEPLGSRTTQVTAANQAASPAPGNYPPGWSRKAGIPGSHSEVVASDAALRARPGAQMSDLAIHNVRTEDINQPVAPPMPRCTNCAPITDGARALTD